MPCYRPMPLQVHNPDRDILVPCGQCIGCKLQRSQHWAARIMHEVAYNDEFGNGQACCVLLTYDDDHVPKTVDGKHFTLEKSDVQKFIRRLRKLTAGTICKDIRYFAAGEYGDDFSRPHYHIALVGVDFGDKETAPSSDSGNALYRSGLLSRLWPYGHSSIMDLNYKSAGYIARYCTKKITGNRAKAHYDGRKPEFGLASNRPSLGRRWAELYLNDLYTDDKLSIRGKSVGVPRYYDKILEKLNPERYEFVKSSRLGRADDRLGRKGFPNLTHREINKTARIKHLKRKFEDGNHV